MKNLHEHIAVAGKASEETKERLRIEYANRLGERHLEQFSEDELRHIREADYEKNPFEIALIEKANDITNSVLASVGLSMTHVGVENVHIVDAVDFEGVSGDTSDTAITSHRSRSVVLNSEKVRTIPLKEAAVLLHEIFHVKEYAVLEIVDEKENEWGFYRSGMNAYAPEKKYRRGLGHVHFKGLDEAITAELEKRHFKSVLRIPALQEEKEWMQTEQARTFVAEIAQHENILEDDIFWVSREGKDYELFSYPVHRRVLCFLTKEIAAAHPDQFASEEDVFKLFLSAQYGSGMPRLTKVFDATFGKDSFEVLSMMDDKHSSAVMALDYFRKYKRRLAFKK